MGELPTSLPEIFAEYEAWGLYFFPDDIYPIGDPSLYITGGRNGLLCFIGRVITDHAITVEVITDGNRDAPRYSDRILRIDRADVAELKSALVRTTAESWQRRYRDKPDTYIVKLPHFATHADFSASGEELAVQDDERVSNGDLVVLLGHLDHYPTTHPEYLFKSEGGTAADALTRDTSKWAFILNLDTRTFWPQGAGIAKPRHSPYFRNDISERPCVIASNVLLRKVARAFGIKHVQDYVGHWELGLSVSDFYYSIDTFLKAMQWLIDQDKDVQNRPNYRASSNKLRAGTPYFSELR